VSGDFAVVVPTDAFGFELETDATVAGVAVPIETFVAALVAGTALTGAVLAVLTLALIVLALLAAAIAAHAALFCVCAVWLAACT
jgi:hypothetical protein